MEKQPVISGRTGEYFDNNISVGIMYMIKLAHMVDDSYMLVQLDHIH